MARALSILAVIAIVMVACAVTITRGPEFHHYADARTWLGIPHAGDVLSNLAFLGAAAVIARRSRARYLTAARAGVVAIGIGSAVYHASPSDLTLAFDWGPIALTLVIVTAALIDDRAGARDGRIALVTGCALAIGSVAWWLASGGTHGGNMAPYVAVQVTGIALPTLLALVAPGAIRARWLLAAVAAFAVARMLAAHDGELLAALGISGHSLKHVAAAVAAGCALAALADRR